MKKMNRFLQKFWIVLLSAVMLVYSTPVTVAATELDDVESLTVSGNSISEDTVSGNSISEDTVSGNSISEDTVSGNFVPEDTVSDNSISEDTVSDDSTPEDAVSADPVSEETVSDNSVLEDTVSADIVLEETELGSDILKEPEDILPVDVGAALVQRDAAISNPEGSLNIGDSCTIGFYPLGGTYNSVPSGYRLSLDSDDNYCYISEQEVVLSSKDTKITLFPEPDNIPAGELFVGWEGMSPPFWVASSTVQLGSLGSVYDGGAYSFIARYYEHFVDFDLNGGTTDDPDVFRDSKNPNHVRKERGYMVTPKKSGRTFLGWTTNGTDRINNIEYIRDLDFAKLGNIVKLKAVYSGEPVTEIHTITLTGVSGIDDKSATALSKLGFTISGNVATAQKTKRDSLKIPALSKPGYRFIGWDGYGSEINLKAGSITKDYSFTAVFQREYTLTLSGMGGIDEDSAKTLGDLGFTISGDKATLVFASVDNAFYLPTISREDYELVGWYEIGEDPSTASTSVYFDTSTTNDMSYMALFREVYRVKVKSELKLYERQSFKLTATVYPDDAANRASSWSSSNSNIATVDDNGNVRAKGIGKCTITATSKADPTSHGDCELTILKSEITETDEFGNPINPGNQAVDENTGEMNIWLAGLKTEGYSYTGNQIKPQVHVYDGGKLLTSGTDYTISYKNNTNVSTSVTKDSKKPQITIKMKGQHSGSKTVYFKILPTPVDQLEVRNPVITATYKAKQKNQLKPTLAYGGSKLKYGDKDLSFKWFETDASGNATDVESKCIDPGCYAVKVFAGKSGNFTSSESGYQVATINVYGKVPMSSVKVNGFKSKLSYNNGAAIEQPAVTLSYKSGKNTIALGEGVDYTVSYTNNYNIGTATVVYEAVKDSSGSYTGNYTGKITKTFAITGEYVLDTGEGGNAVVTLASESYTFTNANIKPAVTVTIVAVNDKGESEIKTLTQGKDYTVSYKNNKAVAANNAVNSKGKDIAPQVIVKGKGKYKFADTADMKHGVVRRFTIAKADLSSYVLTIADKAYSKKANAYKSTKITFSDHNYKDLKLKAGKDYNVFYATVYGNDVPAAGETVEVTITAKDNSSYTGTVTGSYRIMGSTHTDIGKAKIVVNPNKKGVSTACTYTGLSVEPGQPDQPALAVTIGSGKKLKKLKLGVDYEIQDYYKNVSPGKNAVILIRGIGKYRGIRAVKFTITAKPLSTCWGGVYGQ